MSNSKDDTHYTSPFGPRSVRFSMEGYDYIQTFMGYIHVKLWFKIGVWFGVKVVVRVREEKIDIMLIRGTKFLLCVWSRLLQSFCCVCGFGCCKSLAMCGFGLPQNFCFCFVLLCVWLRSAAKFFCWVGIESHKKYLAALDRRKVSSLEPNNPTFYLT